MNIPMELIFRQFENGPMDNFQYVIGDAATREVAVVDPAWDADIIEHEIAAVKGKVTAVFLTHGHPDHVNAVGKFVIKHDVPVYISKHEISILKPRTKNLVEFDQYTKLKIGGIEFECLWTPGHSPGCTGFFYKNVLIAGDTIFIDGCGRCDLPGSNPRQQYHSLYDVLMKLPDNTLLFTGHNYGPTPYATLGEQKKTNPYLLCESEEDFLATRM